MASSRMNFTFFLPIIPQYQFSILGLVPGGSKGRDVALITHPSLRPGLITRTVFLNINYCQLVLKEVHKDMYEYLASQQFGFHSFISIQP